MLRHDRVLAMLGALVTFAYVGCASVPDIRFVNDGAETGGPETGGDGPKTDGSKDGSSGGQDATTACTSASPGGGASCCGQVWCIGDCSSANCDLCASSCQAGEFCCGKMGNVMCKTRCP